MMWGWNGWGWGGMLLMMLFWVLVLGGLIALILLAVSAWGRSRTSQSGETRASSDRAIEILKERYARGEITKEQYEQMRRDLMS